MTRLTTVDLAQAQGETRQLLEGVERQLGSVPNSFRTMAVAPPVLKGYLQFAAALGAGKLSARVRELIALAVGEANSCDYCLSAHTYVGRSLLRIDDAALAGAREHTSTDGHEAAALQFAHRLVQTRGGVTSADLDAVRSAGWSDAEIAEIIGNVAINVLTNYFNKAADVDVDFPLVQHGAAEAA
ncbi:MAG: peroxidase-related enzyme [Chloroflexi bacterium]|nr:MAG: peroxidase-related enzyme [Chloroflexota bacterium]